MMPLENKTLETPDHQTFAPTKTIILNKGDVEAKRAEILEYFHQTFSLYENIYECLKDDSVLYERPNRLRHPLIFYYGHTAVFFMNKLNLTGLVANRINAPLEDMMAIGVDEMSWDDLDPNHYDWPTVAQVKEYRDQVRDKVDNFIRNCTFTLPITEESPLWIIMMGIEHERIHLETTSVLIRELDTQFLRDHPNWQPCTQSGAAPTNSLIEVLGGEIALGKSKDSPLYGWDNEYGTFHADVKTFKASKYLVSNQEFLEFIEDKGYQTECYWTKEGWSWCTDTKTQHPHFWIKIEDGYQYRSMLQVMDNYTLAEWQQAKRVGKEARDVKADLQDAWAISDSKAAFTYQQ
ncbi:MAG: 5-histidylcysteine sulfoxide synthase [Rickettsiales bacterium]|nr:5-histidylcysteine sulfoxide synthase [Rickettsiales bacterium]